MNLCTSRQTRRNVKREYTLTHHTLMHTNPLSLQVNLPCEPARMEERGGVECLALKEINDRPGGMRRVWHHLNDGYHTSWRQALDVKGLGRQAASRGQIRDKVAFECLSGGADCFATLAECNIECDAHDGRHHEPRLLSRQTMRRHHTCVLTVALLWGRTLPSRQQRDDV